MPDARSNRQRSVIPTTSMVASATRYPGKAARIYQPHQDWQTECYRHYGICGEARFAAKFFGHAVSRAVAAQPPHIVDGQAGRRPTPVRPPTPWPTCSTARDGQTQMLDSHRHPPHHRRRVLPGRPPGRRRWTPGRSSPSGDGGRRRPPGRSTTATACPPSNSPRTTWSSGSGCRTRRKRIEADSPFRALLPILSEIEWLTRHVFAQITTRLAGRGILFMPQGMSFPPPPDQYADGTAPASRPTTPTPSC